MPMTVTALARRCGVSRSTVLYYESIGLLKAAARTNGNYRSYGEREARRLEQIRTYRELGLPVSGIRCLLDAPERVRHRCWWGGSPTSTCRSPGYASTGKAF